MYVFYDSSLLQSASHSQVQNHNQPPSPCKIIIAPYKMHQHREGWKLDQQQQTAKKYINFHIFYVHWKYSENMCTKYQ